ncbi:hypothetical protein FOXB_16760 [Fusarium oxysporum f. sp. conglutinans Fo5176]|uniref:Uncharacterized protein n=1 Tax=Fusarium oxysporum (strain Fo5176) TaxID=660025 RepID=F9GDM6_FUSOF|nr:hypothetical protein FOXB_16760 [Fusarium oxysporum f. sp. conglutinans Fo5176]
MVSEWECVTLDRALPLIYHEAF